MNNSVFGKIIEDAQKHREINLDTKDKQRNYLVQDPNYHANNWFFENLSAMEIKKTKLL